MKIGTAGWTLPRQWHDAFPTEGSHLERYATVFSCAEINSSFRTRHLRTTYARWGEQVPPDFRFSAKLPRAITHDQSLVATDVLLDVFLEEVTALGNRLGPLLVQLPPSLAFGADIADEFFTTLRALHAGDVVCEPRHPSWFSPEPASLLDRHGIARVAADPACVPQAAIPGGWSGIEYIRLHGSPRMYYSSYPDSELVTIAKTARANTSAGAEQWCIFDNTASGAATGDALRLRAMRTGA